MRKGAIPGFNGLTEPCALRSKGIPVRQLAGALADENPDIVIVSDEIGYGIVPVDAFDREYRETVGRICTELAVYSDKVYRVVCGIGVPVKE